MKIYFTLLNVPKDLYPKTARLLAMCKDVGYTVITISTPSKLIPHSMNHGNGRFHEICAYPNIRDRSGWPAIWGIVDQFNLESSVGNYQQKQIGPNHNLMEEAFKLVNNKWEKQND